MKKVVLRLFLFAIPIFLVGGFLEYFYRTVPNNYSHKKEEISKKVNTIETLLFGDSHCFYGLDPSFFSKNTFNLSGISQTIYFDKLLFEKYVDSLPKLKQVVFCIEYTNLSQEDNTQDDLFRKYYYDVYMDLEVPIISDTDPKKYSLALSRSLKSSLNLIEKYYERGTILNCDANGWGNDYVYNPTALSSELGKQRALAQEDGLTDFTLNKNRIDQIIQLCKKRNIEVVIVSMPVSKFYSENLNQEKLRLIFETCTNFENQNKGYVRYLNLFNDNRFVNQDFYDVDHLNASGARKCTEIVNSFLND